MLSSVNDFGISNISVDMLSRNSNFWKVIFAETVGKIGMSIFTGNPPGSFKVTNSRSLVKCLKGAITSNTFSNISTVKGKSLLYIQRCKIKKIELDLKKIPFQGLWIRIYLFSGALFCFYTIATVARNVLLVSLYTNCLPSVGYSPGSAFIYSSQDTLFSSGGVSDSRRTI